MSNNSEMQPKELSELEKIPLAAELEQLQYNFIVQELTADVPNGKPYWSDEFAYEKKTVRPERCDMPDFIDRWIRFVRNNDLNIHESRKYNFDFFVETCDSLFAEVIDWQDREIKSLFNCKLP